MMRIDPGDRKFMTWPVRGLPDAAPPVMVRFDGGAWMPTEWVVVDGERVGVRILVAGPDADPGDAVVLALGSHAVELQITDYPTIDQVQDAGTILVQALGPVVVETFGVGVEEVAALAPHITISELPALPTDTMFGGSAQKVRADDVRRWIKDVAAVVDVALIGRAALSETARTAIEAAAHAVVVNGAAAYLVSAGFPMKSGVNDNASYSAELENRYRLGLAALVGQVTAMITPVTDGSGGVVSLTPGKPNGVFPVTRFPDLAPGRW